VGFFVSRNIYSYMKYIITESQNNNLKVLLKQVINLKGVGLAFKSVNGFDNFVKIMDVDSPRDFLDLFNDLDQVQSEEYPRFTLFRYQPKHNLMIYDEINDIVYIDYEIWGVVLSEQYRIRHREIKELTKEWLDEVYNLRGIIPEGGLLVNSLYGWLGFII